MKHFILIITSLFVFQTQNLFAQTHGVKINLLSLSTGKVQFQYEMNLTDRSSFVADVGFRSQQFNKGLSSQVGDFISGNAINEGGYRSLQLGLAYRLYGKKSEAGPQGGYFQPGIRWMHSRMDPRLQIEDWADLVQLNFQGNMIGMTLDFGAQWLIKERILIDWNYLGIGAQYGGFSGDASFPWSTVSEVSDLADELNNDLSEAPLINFRFSNSGTTLNGSTKMILPILRTRLSVGIFF